MRAVSNLTLLSVLAARTPMWSADLFTIVLVSGQTFYYTSADQDITCNGHVYAARGPLIDRNSWGAKNTTEVPNLVVQIYSTGTDYADGLTNLKNAAMNGLFDGGYMILERVFMQPFGDVSLGSVTLFGGRFGSVEVNALGIKVTCTASSVVLTQQLPRRTYQATCTHTLYDVGCTLDPASFTDSYVVSSANRTFVAWVGSSLVDPALYLFGTMSITSGAGAGQKITVMNTSSAGVAFAYPFQIIPAPGDTFTCQQGCDKTMARCQSFGNILNYGGFPYIPQPSLGV